MPQSRQRKSSSRSRTKKSSRRKPAGDYTLNWVGAGFALVGGLALTRLGMLGVSLANVFRIFSGDSFYLLTALITGWALFLLFTGRLPKISKRYIFGGALAYAGLLLGMTARTMAAANVHAHFVAATWQILRSDFSLLTTETSSGGGIIGALLYSLTYPLLTQAGSYIIAVLLLVAGGMLIFDVHPSQVFAFLQKCATGTKEANSRWKIKKYQ